MRASFRRMGKDNEEVVGFDGERIAVDGYGRLFVDERHVADCHPDGGGWSFSVGLDRPEPGDYTLRIMADLPYTPALANDVPGVFFSDEFRRLMAAMSILGDDHRQAHASLIALAAEYHGRRAALQQVLDRTKRDAEQAVEAFEMWRQRYLTSATDS